MQIERADVTFEIKMHQIKKSLAHHRICSDYSRCWWYVDAALASDHAENFENSFSPIALLYKHEMSDSIRRDGTLRITLQNNTPTWYPIKNKNKHAWLEVNTSKLISPIIVKLFVDDHCVLMFMYIRMHVCVCVCIYIRLLWVSNSLALTVSKKH